MALSTSGLSLSPLKAAFMGSNPIRVTKIAKNMSDTNLELLRVCRLFLFNLINTHFLNYAV